MIRVLLAALALALAVVVPAAAADMDYRILQRIKMPDGGFDYASADAEKGRIYWTRTDFTDVIDTKTGTLSQLKNAKHGHIAVPVAGTSLLALPHNLPSLGIAIVDAASDQVLADLPAGNFPDGAVYDPVSKLVFVMLHQDGDAVLVDPQARTIVATIKIGGKLEFPATDGAGHVFVNVQTVPDIAVIDVKTRQMTTHYPLAGCEDASGLAYASDAKLLIASCGNGVAKLLAAETGKEVATVPIGHGPDAVIYDPPRRLAFIPCGRDGVLDIISLADPAQIVRVQELVTQKGTRTGAVDVATGRLYLMASEPDPSKPPGGGGRPQPKDGSFEMLVVGQ